MVNYWVIDCYAAPFCYLIRLNIIKQIIFLNKLLNSSDNKLIKELLNNFFMLIHNFHYRKKIYTDCDVRRVHVSSDKHLSEIAITQIRLNFRL